MIPLEVDDIQGAVLRGYRLAAAAYVFVSFKDEISARTWLSDLIPAITSAAPRKAEAKPPHARNVAFTAEGLRALGLSDALLGTFPDEFHASDGGWYGMAARAELLGDTGDSAPRHWSKPLGRGVAHALVTVSAKTERLLEEQLATLRSELHSAGVTVAYEQRGQAMKGQREHFGFADGFAQPALAGEDRTGIAIRPGQGAVDSPWRPIAVGEFIFGYPDEQGGLPVAPGPEALSRNGTFMVYRKLRQDVAGFRAMLAHNARLFGGNEELIAAKIVGRWRDGTPIELSAKKPNGSIARDPSRNNDFKYGEDPEGLRCPVGAHIRRANPRDSLPFEGKLVNRHRMLRRGIPYGPPLPPGAPDDGVERGIVFVCLQSSIARQFEFIQSQWLNDGNPLSLGEDRDIIAGAQLDNGKMTVPGTPPKFVAPLARYVTTRAGEYLFVPGLAGLRWLATLGGDAPVSPQRGAATAAR